MTLEQFKALFSDLARPFSIVVTSLSAAVTPVVIVWRVAPERLDLIAAAALVGAVYAGVGALYWGKSVEVTKIEQAKAAVETERAKSSPPPAEALKPADQSPDVGNMIDDGLPEEPQGDRPPWER